MRGLGGELLGAAHGLLPLSSAEPAVEDEPHNAHPGVDKVGDDQVAVVQVIGRQRSCNFVEHSRESAWQAHHSEEVEGLHNRTDRWLGALVCKVQQHRVDQDLPNANHGVGDHHPAGADGTHPHMLFSAWHKRRTVRANVQSWRGPPGPLEQGGNQLRPDAHRDSSKDLHVHSHGPLYPPLDARDEDALQQGREQDDRRAIGQVEHGAVQLRGFIAAAEPCVHLAGLGVEETAHAVVQEVEDNVANQQRRHAVERLGYRIVAEPSAVAVSGAEATHGCDFQHERHPSHGHALCKSAHNRHRNDRREQDPANQRQPAKGKVAGGPKAASEKGEGALGVDAKALLAVERRTPSKGQQRQGHEASSRCVRDKVPHLFRHERGQPVRGQRRKETEGDEGSHIDREVEVHEEGALLRTGFRVARVDLISAKVANIGLNASRAQCDEAIRADEVHGHALSAWVRRAGGEHAPGHVEHHERGNCPEAAETRVSEPTSKDAANGRQHAKDLRQCAGLRIAVALIL
mmetsp:Transcript_8806/g.20708  ORF Transcript_8806/g.20708 Transcript_8806/m.20708 type:complete len:517 (+) Transcript_8806:193-1743(+)